MSDLLQTLRNERKALMLSVEPILAKVGKIDELMEMYEKAEAMQNRTVIKVEHQNSLNFGDTKDTTIQDKILTSLTAHGKFVKASHFYFPVYQTSEPVSEQKNSISSALNTMRKLGKIDRFKKDNNNNLTFWGLKQWMRDDESPDTRYVDEI